MRTNEVISRVLIDSKVKVVTCVPGFGGTQVMDAFAKLKNAVPVFSFHEEVAFAVALGASIAGKRSAMLTKVHGLAKAANALIDSLYMDISGGMVVLVFEDKGGSHSDNILFAEPLLKGLQLPYYRPAADEIPESIVSAFGKSETLKLPVALILDADVVNQDTLFEEKYCDFQPKPFQRKLLSQLVVPVFAEYQYQVLTAKLKGEKYDHIPKPKIPELPSGLPPDYAEYVKPYIPLMEVFKKVRGSIVFGDTGISTLFALPPYSCVDVCSYMGGSVAMATGACLSGYKNVWAVSGDFSFIAAGHLGIIEAISQNIPVKVLIFKNNKAQTTGGQPVSADALERVLDGYRDFVTEIRNPENSIETHKILESIAQVEKLQIVVANFHD